jgi:nucleotide-binding universal stress UspA family protein
MDVEPSAVVIGVDFGDLSAYAAQLALELFPRMTTMFLVHSGPRPETWAEEWYDAEYAIAVDEGFARILDALGPDRVKAQTVKLPGRPARKLVEFAEDARADLLVVGSYKRGLFRRLATGTVASRVLRAARCPVLVVPEPPRRVATGGATDRLRPQLMAKLQSVTERNGGRRAVVEVDNPSIGAQALVLDYAFLGLDYDPTDDRLQLFLGDAADGVSTRHVTHTITRPESVDVLLGVDGRDHVVRIADSAGQTLITFA